MQDRTVAVITSRWASTRLPGKALQMVGDKPILRWIVDGVKECTYIDDLIVATSLTSPMIINYCAGNNIPYYAGSEDDILDRVYTAALAAKADTVVRIWGDSIFIGVILEDMMAEYQVQKDMGGYCMIEDKVTSYKIAILPFCLLEEKHRAVKNPKDREWFHNYMMDNTQFVTHMVIRDKHPWGNALIDTPEDLERIRGMICRGKSGK